MLKITLNETEQLVILQSIDQDVWPAVRRIVEDNTNESQILSSTSLSIPVWVFLRLSKDLGYILAFHNTKFEIDPLATQLLAQARQRDDLYQTINKCKPFDEALITKKLEEKEFKRKLTAFQLLNVSKLLPLPSGATFSVPGAGKTTEALAFFTLKKQIDTKLLVVCPKNAFAVWEEQIRLCISEPLKITRLVGGEANIRALLSEPTDVLLITYQQLPNVLTLISQYLTTHQTFMFLDESHRIKKGSDGAWTNAVLKLSHLPQSKLILSGTPMPNDISDLLPQFDFMYPEQNAQKETVRELIAPIFVRTTKSQLGLPKLNRKIIQVRMRPKQRNLYTLLRSEEARQLANLNPKVRANLRVFGRSVMRLLQVASNPALLARSNINYPHELFDVLDEGDSPKIEYACLRARELARSGEKTLIWSTFVENVELIATRLADIGSNYIHGGVEAGSEDDADTRESKISKFHKDDQAWVLVANPAACSESISLHTVCHNAIYVDRNYNAAQYLQSEDRIHRLGLPLTTITNVEILVCPETVDESVQKRLEKKVQVMADILNDDSLNIEPIETDLDEEGLDEEDLKDYLSHISGLK